MPQPQQFFPRDRQFWLFHGSAMAFGFVVSVLMVYLDGHRVAPRLAASTLWMPLYTVAVLCFRWHYRQRGWKHLAMGRLIPIAVAYSALAGVAMALLIVAIVVPPPSTMHADAVPRASPAMPSASATKAATPFVTPRVGPLTRRAAFATSR